MTLDLKLIKARCEAATKEPWEVSSDGYTIWGKDGLPYIAQVHPFDHRKIGNSQFIAHARQDLPACIAEIERLRKRLEWIAQQGCCRFEENGEMDCDQTTDCITEWCLPCSARKALEQG